MASCCSLDAPHTTMPSTNTWTSLTGVAPTRSQAGCPPVVTCPVNDDMISQVRVGPDILSERV